MSGFPLPSKDGRLRHGLRLWLIRRDSRECPGPISEATLHRPSASRALTAGAIALAAIAPAIDPAEHAAEAVQAAPPVVPEAMVAEGNRVVRSAAIGTDVAFVERSVTAERASRAAVRRTESVSVARRQTGLAARTMRAAKLAAARETRKLRAAAREAARVRLVARRALTPHKRLVVTKHALSRRAQKVMPLGNGMTAVIAYARSQVGKRYVRGGEGPHGFDCSGFTRRAYAQIGVELPHSSGAQAARARIISRAEARPGDLVVGPGHVGIYMGGGMMIDAGNSRTGVVYRRLYSGLRVARL